MMRFNKIETAQYIKLSEPKLETNNELENSAMKMTIKLDVKIGEFKDKTIVDAVIDYAKKQGITDLFLIDEEFVKNALLNEHNRNVKTNFNKITSNTESLLDWFFKPCPNYNQDICHTKGCRICMKNWLEQEI